MRGNSASIYLDLNFPVIIVYSNQGFTAMNILLIGSGGREHALAWKLLQSPRLIRLYLTAQHAGATLLAQQYNAETKTVEQIKIDELNSNELIHFATQHKIDIAIIGPELPLAKGISDDLRKAGIAVFGPSRSAAQLETSKAFAKNFMSQHHIPTARFATFKEFAPAKKHLHEINYPVVIKASGLAAGKGVFLPDTINEAENILKQLLIDKILGDAANEIIIEEKLIGEEISLLAFTDGKTVRAMPLARDYKRLYENNQGPNTGGMGAYAPVNLPQEHINEWITTILQPTIDGMRASGNPYIGVLYAGLILTKEGPRVLEFNCRFGDPETQVLMPLLGSDLIDIIEACINGYLHDTHIHWKNESVVCVVLAAEGYPQKPEIGHTITGLHHEIPNSYVFHAGTRMKNQLVISHGGRVLGVTAWANKLTDAVAIAYQRVDKIHFVGKHFRKDIGLTEQNKSLSNDAYAAAGVNIVAGNRTVSLMTAAVKSTYGPEVLAGIGAFGGMYHANKIKEMNDPVLVASTDGIGTKVHLAAQANRYESLGHDIVNHSLNDILVQGAKPLFFLDYLAASRLDPEKMAQIVKGMADACREAGCALLGGETAEMPGVYKENMFDVAGTIVGVVERSHALPKNNLKAGDKLIGIKSSGPHTNGYSLIRKIFEDAPLTTIYPEIGINLADVLLAPHRSYLPILRELIDHSSSPIKALAHITGGGFIENIPRVLPKDLDAHIHLNNWPLPPLFKVIQKMGEVPTDQMYRIFNMGIGMIIIVAPHNVTTIKNHLSEPVWEIGELVAGKQHVILHENN